jgi:hypothetical protein
MLGLSAIQSWSDRYSTLSSTNAVGLSNEFNSGLAQTATF